MAYPHLKLTPITFRQRWGSILLTTSLLKKGQRLYQYFLFLANRLNPINLRRQNFTIVVEYLSVALEGCVGREIDKPDLEKKGLNSSIFKFVLFC